MVFLPLCLSSVFLSLNPLLLLLSLPMSTSLSLSLYYSFSVFNSWLLLSLSLSFGFFVFSKVVFHSALTSVKTLTIALQHYLILHGVHLCFKFLWMYRNAGGCTHLLPVLLGVFSLGTHSPSHVHTWCRNRYQGQDSLRSKLKYMLLYWELKKTRIGRRCPQVEEAAFKSRWDWMGRTVNKGRGALLPHTQERLSGPAALHIAWVGPL